MSLRFILIELRPNLKCANIFLQFDQSLTETDFLKINVEEDAIILREFSTETRAVVKDHFEIDAQTMSNLVVEECNASFRISINNMAKIVDKATSPGAALVTVQPALTEGHAAVLVCSNCKSNITADFCAERIREYPSGSIDINEFFCHRHEGETDLEFLLQPKHNDLFYGFNFVVLNESVVSSFTRLKNEHIYCRRCLQYLGETKLNKSFKLWTDTLLLRANASSEVFENVLKSTSTASSVYQLLLKIVYECCIDAQAPHCLQTSKILLHATFPNREQKHLMLHILEKQLQIVRNTQPLAHGGHNNNNALIINLQHINAFKLLYRICLDNEDDTDDSDDDQQLKSQTKSRCNILQQWQTDMAIQTMQISPTLFASLLNELEENSLLLPEMYRFNKEKFILSYIFHDA